MLDKSSPPHDLLPGWLRRPLAVAAGVALVVFVVLTVHVMGGSWAGSFDLGVDRIVAGHRALHSQWTALAEMAAQPLTVSLLGAVGALAALLARQYRLAALAVLGPGLTGVATTLLKPAIGRTIADGSYSFPSGHTAGATSIGLVVAIAVVSLARPGKAAALAVLVLVPVTLGTIVAIAMIAEHAHYPTDTIGGFCTALVMVSLAAVGIDAVAARIGRRKAPHPS